MPTARLRGIASKLAIGILVLGHILFLTGCLKPPVFGTPAVGQQDRAKSQSGQKGKAQNTSLQRASIKATATPSMPEGMIVVPPPANAQADENEPVSQNNGVPEAFKLDKVPVGKQTRPLNCEFQTASDMLWYYGYPYSWDEIYALVGPDLNGNPHEGFVGNSLDDPPGGIYPDGYGVYAEPIARSIESIGLKAEVHYGESAEWLKQQIAAGNPVMVWATANMIVRPPEYWKTKDGQMIQGVRGEHTYLVFGYDREGVWVADPWDGKRHHYPWMAFLASWDILQRMSLIVSGPYQNASAP